MIKKAIKYIGVTLLTALVLIQFIKPEKNNSGYEGINAFKIDTRPSIEVFSILKTHCFDCHSNQTKYPWYAEVAPISFWLEDHVVQGKKHFNMSTWDSYSIKKRDHKLEELIEEIEEGEMPLNSYTWIHGNLSSNDKDLLIQWALIARLHYKEGLNISSK